MRIYGKITPFAHIWRWGNFSYNLNDSLRSRSLLHSGNSQKYFMNESTTFFFLAWADFRSLLLSALLVQSIPWEKIKNFPINLHNFLIFTHTRNVVVVDDDTWKEEILKGEMSWKEFDCAFLESYTENWKLMETSRVWTRECSVEMKLNWRNIKMKLFFCYRI